MFVFVVCRLLLVVMCCMWLRGVVWCLCLGVRCWLCVVCCCLLYGVCYSLRVACRCCFVGCCVLIGAASLFGAS